MHNKFENFRSIIKNNYGPIINNNNNVACLLKARVVKPAERASVQSRYSPSLATRTLDSHHETASVQTRTLDSHRETASVQSRYSPSLATRTLDSLR
jgi:hypothetical protein